MLARLLLAGASAGAALLLAELALPVLLGVSRPLLLMGFYALPESNVDDVHINEMGFTGADVRNPKAVGTVRLLTLGGSAFFNRRMTERLTQSLEPVARESGHTLELLGAALRTHTVRASRIKFEYLKRYDFDGALIYHAINDLWIDPAAEAGRAYSHISPWYDRGELLDRCVLCRFAYNGVFYRRPVPERRAFLPGDRFPTLSLFESELTLLVEELRGAGVEPILMSFAWSIPEGYSDDAFREGEQGYHNPERYDRSPVDLWGPPRYVETGLRAHNAAIRAVARRGRVALIDQEQRIGRSLRLFGDVCHLSEEGTEAFVGNIASFLRETRWFELRRER